jgi:hypothetical protein
VAFFCWRGDRIMDTLLLRLQARGLDVERDGLALTVSGVTADGLAAHVGALAAGPPADPVALARTVANNVVEKHHPLLSEELLALDYATGRLDAPGAAALAARSG